MVLPACASQGLHTSTLATNSLRDPQSLAAVPLTCALQEVTLLYNLCNEPWLKYTMAAVADRGLKPSQWTSVRLQTEVMLAETRT